VNEQQAIELLSQYRQKQARLQVLSSYSVGAGITISRLNEDDHLQELHRRLRGLPSYMYLSKREQQLETVAHAYLERYPAGTRAQLAAVPRGGADEEDERLLRELRVKIQKVIAARGWDVRDDIDAVLDRLAEYQDLRAEIERVDTVLAALEQYKPDLARVLRLRYVEGLTQERSAVELGISVKTERRREKRAISEFVRLVS
jgi:DNA-directed RNA polymerase specialized sigma24 family protein